MPKKIHKKFYNSFVLCGLEYVCVERERSDKPSVTPFQQLQAQTCIHRYLSTISLKVIFRLLFMSSVRFLSKSICRAFS